MATMSATQHIPTITPPSSSHGGGNGLWNIENQTTSFPDERPFKSNQFDSRQPLGQNSNANRKMSYGSDRANYAADGEYGGPRKNNLRRKKSGVRHDSESDGSLDTYKLGQASRSLTNGIDKSGKRKPSNAKLRTPEEDESNWIHRDKLAQIESRELEEAGFPVRASRAGSRSTVGNYSRQDQHYEQDDDFDSDEYRTPKNHDPKRQRVVSPIPAEDEDEAGAFDFELRTPEEVAAEQESRQYFHSPAPNKFNGTRIPMPKQSPVPLPSIIMERDSPLPRSRTSSGNGIHDIRPRSRSMSSQVMLDDDMPRTPVDARRPASASDDSPSSSPPKGRGAKGGSGTRKASGQRVVSGTSKYRATSQQARASPEKRPGTSGGRPSTSHRPEGDPPWLASMYKPDPRLPPDQQMLPTHAKRMAQEKWEKEGKTGTAYDKEFRLLNTEEIERPLGLNFDDAGKDKPEPVKKPSNIQVGQRWPLASPLASPMSQSSRPGTGGTEHGGYSTMPKISSPPPVATPTTAEKPPQPKEPIRLPEPLDDGKEKKGCCCIVM